MKKDILLEEFNKKKLNSDDLFKIKGGEITSVCWQQLDVFNTQTTTTFSNADPQTTGDKTLVGSIFSIFSIF